MKQSKHLTAERVLSLTMAWIMMVMVLAGSPIRVQAAPGDPYPVVKTIWTNLEGDAAPGVPFGVFIELTDLVTDDTGTIFARIISPNRKVTINLELARRSDGIYQGAITPGTWAEQGTWQVDQLTVKAVSGEYLVHNITDYPDLPDASDLTGGNFYLTNANSDTIAPTVKSVSVDPTKVYLGESALVTVETADNISGVASTIELTYLDGAGIARSFTMTQAATGKYTASIPVTATTKGGSWKISKLDLQDRAGNAVTVWNGTSTVTKVGKDLSAGNFTAYLIPPPDVTKPVISLSVNKKQVSPTESVTLTLNATDANGITGRIYGSYKAPDYAANPSAASKTFEFLPKTTGVWEAQVTLGPTMGTWIFDSVSVKDPAGNEAVLANQRLHSTGTNLDYLNIAVGVTVSFNSQGGSAVPSQFTSTGLVVQPTAPTREGMDFAGWYKEAATLNAWNFATSKATQSLTLYAKWVPIPVDVTKPVISLSVDKNQAGTTEVVTVTLNASDATGIAGPIYGSYKAPDYTDNPSAAMKRFEFLPKTAGVWQAQVTLGPGMGTWIFDSVSVKDPAGNEAVLANQRLYSTGTNLDHLNVAVGLTVTFNSQGGSAVPSQFTTSGLVAQPPAPTKAGMTFAGWYQEATTVTAWNFVVDKATQSMMLYAKWVSPPAVAAYYAKTTANSLNFRSGPAASYSAIGTIPYGSIIVVRAPAGTWFAVEYQGKSGYVSGTYVTKLDQTKVYQTKTSLNYRTGPSTAYSIIKKLEAGTLVEMVAKTTSTWWQISVNGTKGYASAAYLTSAPALSSTAPAPVPTPTPTPTPTPSEFYRVLY